MADEFCLKMPDFQLTFRDLLHAVNLRHGTNGFTSLPKGGVQIFSPRKIRRLQPCLNPRTWVPKASTPPLDHRSRFPPEYLNNRNNRLSLTKGKGKLVHGHAMKLYGGAGGITPPVLNFVRDGHESSASRSFRFAPGKKHLELTAYEAG